MRRCVRILERFRGQSRFFQAFEGQTLPAKGIEVDAEGPVEVSVATGRGTGLGP